MTNTCPYCGKRYTSSSKCDYLGTDPMPLPYDAPSLLRCPQCNVAPGNPHHAYCERAECGICGGLFAECGGLECGGRAA